jgi:hypothetical protein
MMIDGISMTAVTGARRRFPRSTAEYLLSPPHSWAGAFDRVVEVYTLHVLTGAAQRTAIAHRPASHTRRPGTGHREARDKHDDPGAMPWPLTRTETESFRRTG